MKRGMLQLLIDTDTAGDDTIALLLALKTNKARLEAITINCGNIAFDQQVENALYTVELAGKSGKVPVYPGARHPLLRDWYTVEYVHGKDGMGESYFPKASQRPEKKHAVDEIVDLINDNPGKITMIEQAPMTNMALALRKDPTIARKIGHYYFMGGTNQFLGNVTPAAEFNIWVDPDAAKIVLHSGMPITMVGWEICMKYGLVGSEDYRTIKGFATKESEFFLKVNRVVRRFTRATYGRDATTTPDSITVAIALYNDIATKVLPKYVEVDNESELSRGATIVDHLNVYRKRPFLRKTKPNVDVVYEASERRFKDVLFKMLKGEKF
jgi:purine nucleosidase